MNESISQNRKDSKRPRSGKDPLQKVTVGDIQPFSTVDYPGHLAAVFFTQGCSWRCPYCYNVSLQPFKPSREGAPSQEIEEFLRDRKGFLDAVVFCGGEPLEQPGLKDLAAYVKDMGYEIALHTNGTSSKRLKALLPLCNWVGMDIKAPFEKYEKITKAKGSGKEAKKSAETLIKSGIAYEFRTTYHPSLLSEDDLLEIARELAGMGARHLVIQAFQEKGCQDPKLKAAVFPEGSISEALKKKIRELIADFQIRS
jgi:anaerobic ribonucleoside-triphosphate reductase activating protein